MNPFLAVTFCLLVTLEPVDCQRAGRKLQPWVQGTIAVTVFLVLAMVVFVINRLWCQDKDDSLEEQNKVFSMTDNKEELVISNGTEGRYSTTVADFSYDRARCSTHHAVSGSQTGYLPAFPLARCEEGHHVYENKVELECGDTIEYHGESNIEVLTTCM